MNWILTYSLKSLIRLGILFWSTMKSTQLTMGTAEDICKQKWGQLIRQFAYIWMIIFRVFFFSWWLALPIPILYFQHFIYAARQSAS